MSPKLKGALYLAPVIIGFFLGKIVCFILSTILATIAYYELHKAFKMKNIFLSPVICPFMILMSVFIKQMTSNTETICITALAVAVILSYLGSNYTSPKMLLIGMILMVPCAVYAYFPWFMFYLLSTLSNGAYLLAFVFVVSFATDIFAMISGKKFGKHKLTKVSPNKTIEGSIGGFIGATLCSIPFAFLLEIDILTIICLGGLCSIAAQCGDLFASSIKRFCGIKDFSQLIPGHGGVLDRFDSVIFVIPIVFLATLLVL